jgi:serine/threonine protein kinase
MIHVLSPVRFWRMDAPWHSLTQNQRKITRFIAKYSYVFQSPSAGIAVKSGIVNTITKREWVIMSNLIGHQLGKYKLTALLGRGGMAEVYRAYQPGLERLVAVKVLEAHGVNSPEMIARFKREGRSVALLRHTNIVQVFDFDVEGDLYYMVMEYIDGGTLGHFIYTQGAIPAHEALSLAIQLADGFDYAHQHGVIHRDIKPVNIMFADAEHRHPVITDFGIAYILDDPVVLTSYGRPIGSPAYISPEVARGEQVDERSDIYSFGVTLYEMFTGRIPFHGTTSDEFVIQHINTPPPSPRHLNVAVPAEIENILMKSLAKRRDQRFQSMLELKIALQQVLDSLSTRPIRPQLFLSPVLSQPPKADPRTRILPSLPQAIVASSPVDYGRNHSKTIKLIDDHETPKPRKLLAPFITLMLIILIGAGGLLAFRGTNQDSVGNVGTSPTTAPTLTASPMPPSMTFTDVPPSQTPYRPLIAINEPMRRSAVDEDVPSATSTVTGQNTRVTPTRIAPTKPSDSLPASTAIPTNVPQPTAVPATLAPQPTPVPATPIPPTNAPILPIVSTALPIVPTLLPGL